MFGNNIPDSAEMSDEMYYKAYQLFFGTLTSQHRLRILNELRKKPMNVSELIEKLGVEQTVISHNLKRLLNCGFVKIEKQGRFRIYSLNQITIRPLMSIIDEHMKHHCLRIISKSKNP